MIDVFDAVERHRQAGLANEVQASILRNVLSGDAAAAAVDRATASGRSLTLTEVEALAGPNEGMPDRLRYCYLFGRLDDRINDFAMMRKEIAQVTARAIARGTPMTENEIAWLDRNVIKDDSVVY